MINKTNLLALADYLDTHVDPDHFRMGGAYASDKNNHWLNPPQHRCMTCACALGYATKLFEPQGNEGWSEYAERVFDIEVTDLDPAYAAMFDDHLSSDPHEAADRIRSYVKCQPTTSANCA